MGRRARGGADGCGAGEADRRTAAERGGGTRRPLLPFCHQQRLMIPYDLLYFQGDIHLSF